MQWGVDKMGGGGGGNRTDGVRCCRMGVGGDGVEMGCGAAEWGGDGVGWEMQAVLTSA